MSNREQGVVFYHGYIANTKLGFAYPLINIILSISCAVYVIYIGREGYNVNVGKSMHLTIVSLYSVAFFSFLFQFWLYRCKTSEFETVFDVPESEYRSTKLYVGCMVLFLSFSWALQFGALIMFLPIQLSNYKLGHWIFLVIIHVIMMSMLCITHWRNRNNITVDVDI